MSVVPPNTLDFFTAGGTLRPDSPSYVERPADRELLEHVLQGDFCYILTPRQMGKSSLMIRTARRLAEQDAGVVIVDLTQIGTVSVDQWYLGLLTHLKKRLRLSVDPAAWWQAREALGATQRFTEFMGEVVLAEVDRRVVIFIDEIDSTLKLDFRDDFFAAIRAMHNARASDPHFERLTFVLLGVASPADLIKDRARTPFNIGHEIPLRSFSRADAAVLEQGLEAACPMRGAAVLDRIFYWTGGHPYLTQKLCQALVEQGLAQCGDPQVDALVRTLFLTEAARRETNLQFVRDNLLNHPHKDALLKLYARVLRGKTIADDKQSLLQNQLKLSGLVTVVDGRLAVNNTIYREAFNLAWVRENTAVNWAPWVAGAAVLVALFVTGILLYNVWTDARATRAENCLYEPNPPDQKLACLATLFRLQQALVGADYANTGRELFYDFSAPEQREILRAGGSKDDRMRVYQRLYITMADLDLSDAEDPSRPLLEAIQASTAELAGESPTAAQLQVELQAWLAARDALQAGRATDALERYSAALSVGSNNPATYFERAQVYIQQSNFEQALSDLDSVVLNAESAGGPAGTPTPPAAEPTDLLGVDISTRPPNPTAGSAGSTGQPANQTSAPLSGTLAPGATRPPATIARVTQVAAAGSTQTPYTPTPTPTPTPAPVGAFDSDFSTTFEMVSQVRRLLERTPPLAAMLAGADNAAYPNLAARSLLPPTATRPATLMAGAPTSLVTGQVTARPSAAPVRTAPAAPSGDAGQVMTVAYSPDGRFVSSGSDNGTVQVWEAATQREVARMQHDDLIFTVAFSPDGRSVVSASRDDTARVWDAATGEEVARMVHEDFVQMARFSPDGQWVVSGSDDGITRVWEANTGSEVARATQDGWVLAVAFSPDGSLVASGGQSPVVRVWEAATGSEVARFTFDDGGITDLAFSPDGRAVATAGEDGFARIWDIETGQNFASMQHDDRVNRVAFSPDGSQVVSSGDDGAALVWSVPDVPDPNATSGGSGGVVEVLEHENAVFNAVFNPDGRYLVSGSANGAVRIWNTATWVEVASTVHPAGSRFSEAFSPDGGVVVTGNTGGGIQLLAIPGYVPQDAGTTAGFPALNLNPLITGWKVWGQRTNGNLRGIKMISPNDGWIVGENGTLLRWDGSDWSAFDSPTEGHLFSIDLASATDGWASGQAEVYRWDGERWSPYGLGDPGAFLWSLDLLDESFGWMAGEQGRLYRWDGQAWADQSVQDGANIRAISVLSPSAAWVVGDEGLLYEFNGKGWNSLDPVAPNHLLALDVVSEVRAFAVGAAGIILHFDGGWHSADSPTSKDLYAIDMLSSSDGWAAGADGALLHYDGGAWSSVTVPTLSTIYDVAMLSSREGWAVGSNGTILYYNTTLPAIISP